MCVKIKLSFCMTFSIFFNYYLYGLERYLDNKQYQQNFQHECNKDKVKDLILLLP